MKLDFNKLLHNNMFIWALSLAIAIVVWFVVIDAVDPNTSRVIYDVPVRINVEDSSIARLGINAIVEEDILVNVEVQSERYVVGNLKRDDIQVTADLTGVTGAGTYELRLDASPAFGSRFTVLNISPATVAVQFDRIVTKTLPVQVELEGVTFPDGYLMQDEYATPGEVTITGPEMEVAQIVRCVAQVEVNRTLTTTENIRTRIELLDQEGEVVTSAFITTDVTAVDITVPILKIREVPVKVEFNNVPRDFPLEDLRYTLSAETVTVAGPANQIDNLDSVDIGYLDMKELDMSGPYTFDVRLPGDFVNVDNMASVTVTFDESYYISRTFTVTDIRIINNVSNYDATVTTTSIANVQVYGPPDVINTLAAGDIIAEIDLSSQGLTTQGQVRLPVDIVIPGKGTVWANGHYTAQVSVRIS